MKTYKTYLIIAVLSVIVKFTTAQINITSTGLVSLNNTGAPMSVAGIGVQSFSNMVFSTATTGVTSAPFIRSMTAYSTASTPDYTFYNDYGTGLFHPSSGELGFAANYSEGMRITNTQNVLIGQTTGSDRVDITGSLNQDPLVITTNQSSNYGYSAPNYVNNTTTKVWAVEYGGADKFYVTGSGSVWSNVGYYTSDSTLKENFQAIKDPLKKVLQLNGITYNFKADKAENTSGNFPAMTRQMGFLAQAVERVVPELVGTNDKGLKGINYACMVSLLVEAIKEQNKRIDSLQATIENCCQNNQLLNSVSSPSNNGATASLYQNNPNPFNKETTIGYFLPSGTQSATLMVVDMEGKLIKSITVTSYGQGAVKINAGDFSAGLYYYTLIADGKEVGTKKMILTQ